MSSVDHRLEQNGLQRIFSASYCVREMNVRRKTLDISKFFRFISGHEPRHGNASLDRWERVTGSKPPSAAWNASSARLDPGRGE
jgi:hypothetical protein